MRCLIYRDNSISIKGGVYVNTLGFNWCCKYIPRYV